MDQFIREIWYVICVFHQALPSPTVFNRDERIKHIDNYDLKRGYMKFECLLLTA